MKNDVGKDVGSYGGVDCLDELRRGETQFVFERGGSQEDVHHPVGDKTASGESVDALTYDLGPEETGFLLGISVFEVAVGDYSVDYFADGFGISTFHFEGFMGEKTPSTTFQRR